MADSAFIQEWPENKLTVAELRTISPIVSEYQDGVDEPDEDFESAARKLKAALDKAEEGIEPSRKAESPVYFFGCTKGIGGNTQAGHYFYVEGPTHDSRPRKPDDWLGENTLPKSDMKIDGGFCPHYQGETQYAKAKLTHWGGWTAIGMWDSSGDTRPKSDTNFFMKGTLDFEDAMDEARRVFGPVIERCEAKYGPIECVQEVER